MGPSFDPYHKWLGIPSDEQPPNHYRLLGIREFEADPDVIQAAADQRMAHLRTYQTSRFAEWSQRLLNEVAAAKICLLSPAKKAAYDQKLSDLPTKSESGKLSPLPLAEEPEGRAWRAAPQRIELLLSPGPHSGPLPEGERDGGGKIEARSKRRWPKGTLVAIGVLMATAAAAIAGLAYWSKPRETPAAVAKPHTPPADRDRTPIAELPTDRPAQTKRPAAEPVPESRKRDSAAEPVPESWPSDRVVLPPAAAQDEALNLARDLYHNDLAKAKTAAEKQALARTLLAEAKAAKSADVSTLVLLRLAHDTAVQASDVATAFAAIDALAARYRVDPREMKRATLSTCAETARTPAQHLALAEHAERLRDELAAAGASAQAAALARLAALERDAAGAAKP